MLFVSTAEGLTNSVGKLVSTEQPLGLNYLPLAINPLRLDRIEPRAISLPAIGTDHAATLLLTVGDNPERLGSEASFASLCGVSPVRGVLR